MKYLKGMFNVLIGIALLVLAMFVFSYTIGYFSPALTGEDIFKGIMLILRDVGYSLLFVIIPGLLCWGAFIFFRRAHFTFKTGNADGGVLETDGRD